MAGVFIALEGIDGSGKSTIAERLIAAVRARGQEAILTREPGGTAIGEQIRAVLLGETSGTMLPQTETLLFAAARAQHVSEVIRPALSKGAVVVSDRFSDSSLAYQWGGRELDKRYVIAAQRLATAGLEPDLVLLLDLPVEKAHQRRRSRMNQTNRLDDEAPSFRNRVRNAYLSLAAADPARWRVIDAGRDLSEVWSDAWTAIVRSGLVQGTCLPVAHGAKQKSPG